MPADLPDHLLAEEDFAEFCEQRRIDETEEAWRAYEAWLSHEEWIIKYGEDPTGYGEPFTGTEVDPAPFGVPREAA